MDVLMPQLGETVAEGTVSAWHKQEGDKVEADEILLDVETDKVSMEIPAPKTGTLTKILVQTGDTVDVGTVLAVIQADGEVTAGPADTPAQTAAPATLSDAPVTAAASVATPIASVSTLAPAARNSAERLSPAVRRLVAEHQIDLSAIAGSGRSGRVTRRDVIQHIESGPAPQASSATPATVAATAAAALAAVPTPSTAAQPAGTSPGLVARTIPFNRIRRLTAEHMVRSKATSPHVLQAVEVDFSAVEQVRKSAKDAWKAKHQFSLTYLPFIANAVCTALREYPNANASIGDDELVLHDHINLAIAVDLGPEGLVAPVIKSAETLSVAELATAIHDLAARARNNRLSPDDLVGGTYTLSNSGSFGTLITAAIINQPQVAILSTDGVRKKPVVIEHPEGDSIAIRPIGILAQSFDHRAIDGAYSAAFLDRTRKILETSDWSQQV